MHSSTPPPPKKSEVFISVVCTIAKIHISLCIVCCKKGSNYAQFCNTFKFGKYISNCS
jgi:hypothetical protein